jgi:acyl-CoA synthetase (AMP-forming)/AMP-acid ligase II
VPATTVVPSVTGRFETVADVMDAAAAHHGDREAYVDGSERLSFAQWIRAADGLAATLADRGVRPGDVVALWLPSSIDYAICYAALARVGAVTTGINTRLGPREVGAILDRARPALVIRDESLDGCIPPSKVPVMTRGELQQTYGAPGLGGARARGDPTDPVVIIWTSGSTGLPKGAWFDHRNLAAAVATAGVMSAPFDRRLVGTPFPHAGYMAKLWDQLVWGSTVVISPSPWTAGDMLRLLVEERVTVAGAVPTQWAKLLEHPHIEQADLSHIRLCLAATAPASPDLIERVTGRLGSPMIVRYAMTESPSITGTEPGDPPEVLYRTVGRPQTGVEVVVADDTGKPVPLGEVGRVRVRGDCVMRGYWGAPDLTARVLAQDGWLTSTDLGYLDPDDNLVLVGRANDMYIRGGYNVYPLEVEHVLAEHPGIDKVAVVGVPAPVIGEIGVAFVVPAEAANPPSLAELRAWTVQRLADFKAPDRLEIVEELPLTAMLKVDKAALREGVPGAVTAPPRAADGQPRVS